MNKRDFLIQGGALVGAATGGTAWAGHAAPSLRQSAQADAHDLTHMTPGTEQARWQAMAGERFSGLTALGRPVELVLSEVVGNAMTGAALAGGAEQFTVSFEGPRALPLQAGMHLLNHPSVGAIQLYLEPVSQGERIGYDAHFSLLGHPTV